MADYQERVVLKIDGDSKGLKSSLTSTAFSFNQITQSANVVIKAIQKVYEGMKQCVSEYSTVDRLNTRLVATWGNVGAKTGWTANQVLDYADALEKCTYFEAESIQQSAQLLASTQKLSNDGFKRALDLSVDLAEAMGTDVTNSANTLAKALITPADGLNRLKQLGVAFTDEEEEQIKTLVEAGNEYEAQEKILEQLESRYKGVAKAVADTDSNTLTQIGNTLGTIREDLGQGILDAVSPALTSIYNWLLKIEEWAGKFVSYTTVKNSWKREGAEGVQDAIKTASADKIKEYYEQAKYDYDTYVGSLADELSGGKNGEKMKAFMEELASAWVKKSQEEYELTNLSLDGNGGNGGGGGSTPTGTLADFISSNAGSSLTQQYNDLQAIVDEAEKWKGTVAEGSEEYKILDEIITSTKEQQDALFDTDAVMSWSDVFATGLQSVMSGLEDCMESLVLGEASWGSFAKAGLEAIASILEALGSQLTAQAVACLLTTPPNFAGFGTATAGALGAYAGAGLVRGLAGRFEYGGIVGGTGITGDKHMIFANAGELILSKAQQGAIAGQLQGANSSFSPVIQFNGNVFGDERTISEFVYAGIKEAQRKGEIAKW